MATDKTWITVDGVVCRVDEEVRDRMDQLQAENKRLAARDGNATIEVCYDDGTDPFARAECRIVDFGVADNIYVVELLPLKKGGD